MSDGEAIESGSAPADADLAAQVEVLAEENRRLRREYARARRSQYRRSAIGLAVVGLLAAGGGLLFPAAREVLFALAATGLFGAVLTYYLTPERFIAAGVGDGIYGALAAVGRGLVDELGLSDHRVYVPTDDAPAEVRLYVPQRSDFDLPDRSALGSLFVVTADDRRRGLALEPTGLALFREFETTLSGPLGTDSTTIADQLGDGLTDQFELADRVVPEVDADEVRFSIAGTPFGPVDRFDHPVPSFLAVGLARGQDRPVAVTVAAVESGRADYVVRCAALEAD